MGSIQENNTDLNLSLLGPKVLGEGDKSFTVEAQSWSIPEGGVFVLFGKQCTAAVQVLNICNGADGYAVEFEYRIY